MQKILIHNTDNTDNNGINFVRKRCQCYIVSNSEGYRRQRHIFKHELTNLPQFLRFDDVEIHYESSVYVYALPIAKKCESVVNYLRLLKLNDLKLVHFNGTIDKYDRNNFSSYPRLLDHLRNELLPICGPSRRYIFEISFNLDLALQTNLIANILQMPQIDCCSNVEIKLHGPTLYQYQIQFPIEPISNWLHRNCDGSEEKSKERFLRICPFSFNSARELCDYLKKVIILLTLKINSALQLYKFRHSLKQKLVSVPLP